MTRPRPSTLLAGAVVLAALAVQTLYIRADHALPTYDDAWYIEQSFRLFDALRAGLGTFFQTYTTLFRIKAPLIAVLPLPFIALFGRSLHAVLMVDVVSTLVIGAALFLLARRLYSGRAGVFALLITFTFPLLYGLSRRYFVEYALTACVCAWILLLEDSDGLRKPGRAVALGILLGLGLLLKVTFPLYILGPVLVTAWGERGRWSRGQTRRLLRGVLPPALFVAGTWYAFNWMYVAGFAWQAGFGDIARQYGDSSWRSVRFMAGHIVHAGISEGHGALLLVALLSWAARRRTPGREGALLLSWLAFPLLALFAAVNKELRYLAPALPALALLVAGELDARLPKGLPGAALFLLALAPPLDGFAAQTAGVSVRASTRPLPYGGPPAAARDLSQEEILTYLERETSFDRANRSVVIGIEHPYLNANLFACLAAMRNSPLRFSSLGYAQDSVEKALIRIKERDAGWVLTAEGFPEDESPLWLNRSNAGVEARLRAGFLGFRKARTFRFADGAAAALYSRPLN